MVYPPVTHKIPELFQTIIGLDRSYLSALNGKVINLGIVREYKKTRRDYSTAAQTYLKRQRGTT